MRYRTARPLPLLLGIIIGSLLCACSNSEGVDYANYAEITTNSEEYWNTKVDYLPLDDSEYPYAGIPRIVIETENHREIKDRETEIPAKLQIWGEHAPESEVMELTIRGRGNSTWGYPKKPYAIKFNEKQAFLGMPKAKKWVMLANYRDRTLIRNAVAFEIARRTSLAWTPSGKFVDVFLNKKFIGNYYVCEKIEVKKNRLELDEDSFLLEYDSNYDEDFKFKSKFNDFPINIKHPKEPSDSQFNYIQNYINDAEHALHLADNDTCYLSFINQESFADYFIVYAFIYKNFNGTLTAGPVWDFDYSTFDVNKKGFTNKTTVFVSQFLEKDAFKKILPQRWSFIKSKLSDIDEFIDSLSNYIVLSNKSNYAIWPINIHRNTVGDEKKNFNDAINMLKKAIHSKIFEIDSLLQSL